MAPQTSREGSIKALSISHYTLFFFLLLALILAGMVWATLEESALARNQLAASDRLAAIKELKDTHLEIAKLIEGTRQRLESWDEIHQQLYDPMFYGHWRATRAFSGGKLPSFVQGMELYDKRGKVLAGGAKEPGARMPGHIQLSHKEPFIETAGSRADLYYFFPIFSDGKRTTPLGFAGIRLDHIATLKTLHALRYIDVDSLKLGNNAGSRRVRLNDAWALIDFKLNKSDAFDTAERIMASSLLRIALLCGVAALFAYIMITSLVTRPLRTLAKSIDALREGQGAVLSDSYKQLWPVLELEQLRNAFNDYQTRLEDMHLNLEGKNKELWNLAHFDPLTGVYNRRAFEEDWNRLSTRAIKSPFKLAFLLFDCDHFKAINDTYGHHVGDLVINGIARSLDMALRSRDRLYRLGGDEFVTLLYDTDLDQAASIAQRCIAEVCQNDFSKIGISEPVQISAGLAWWDGRDMDVLCLLHKQADLAMYHAKKPGQAKLALYTDEIADSSQAVVSSRETRAVYEAIGSNGANIEMHYQKLIRLPSNEADYYEALVRIRHAEGLISPFDIFSVVEARRLEVEFDSTVIETIARDLERGAIPAGSGVSINISGPSIINRGVTDRLLRVGAANPAYRLSIEITETALITQLSHAASNLEQLRNAGFKVALDDFGSGYSPLRYLSSMPIDVVKFDIALIHSLLGQDRQALIVSKLAQLIRDSGYDVVAEGIENQDLLNRVTELGFTHAQGYFIERPQPVEKLAQASSHLIATN